MTKITRRTALTLGGAAFAAPAIGRANTALPDRTLKILVGFPAGGGTDVMARFIAEALKQRTGRNIIIENKGGASGTLAGEALKNSPPDGTTVCYMPSATVVQKLTMASIPFDPQTDLAPVTLAGTVQTAFWAPSRTSSASWPARRWESRSSPCRIAAPRRWSPTCRAVMCPPAAAGSPISWSITAPAR
jgi:tripartite-type tricarboxylate transporter receptor subunit TctC